MSPRPNHVSPLLHSSTVSSRPLRVRARNLLTSHTQLSSPLSSPIQTRLYIRLFNTSGQVATAHINTRNTTINSKFRGIYETVCGGRFCFQMSNLKSNLFDIGVFIQNSINKIAIQECEGIVGQNKIMVSFSQGVSTCRFRLQESVQNM